MEMWFDNTSRRLFFRDTVLVWLKSLCLLRCLLHTHEVGLLRAWEPIWGVFHIQPQDGDISTIFTLTLLVVCMHALKRTRMSAYALCFYLTLYSHNTHQTIFYFYPPSVLIILCPWRRTAMTRQDKQQGKIITSEHWSLMPEAISNIFITPKCSFSKGIWALGWHRMLAVAVNRLIPTAYIDTVWLLQTCLSTFSQPECMFLSHKRHIKRVKENSLLQSRTAWRCPWYHDALATKTGSETKESKKHIDNIV